MGRQKRTKEEVEIINVRLPRKAISWIDSLIKKGIYSSRSEAIREFVREYLLEAENRLLRERNHLYNNKTGGLSV